MAGTPGTTKKVATIAWSIGVAAVLLMLTVSVLLPSTKRARLDFGDGAAEASPTTAPATSSPAHIFGSKSAVFDIRRPGAATAPTTVPVP